jgi:hypothetical protein
MHRTHLPHYHIRWSGKTTLDWEPFHVRADAEARAKELAGLGETYAIEETDGTCPQCHDAMDLTSAQA